MSYAICNVEKMVMGSISEKGLRETIYPMTKYDLMYMIQRYGVQQDSYLRLVQNVTLTGNDVIVKLGCSSLAYWTSGLHPTSLFKKLYLVDEKLENILRIKRMLVNPYDVSVVLNWGQGLELGDKTVDIIYSSNLDLLSEEKQKALFSEGIRILKNEGIFCYIKIVEDYYASIHRLLAAYDLSLGEKSLDERHYYVKQTVAEKMLNQTFSDVTVNEYESLMVIDNVDDFIGFILSDSEFKEIKYQLFKSGISKFRLFLQQQIDRCGGIKINRKNKVYMYKQRIIYS